jgi:CBS domain containing-hemolysin-like protein
VYNIGLILVALGFVFLNGFFVMAEFAMVKLRHTRVQMLKNTAGWRGAILAKVHTNLDAYLSACQLGITLASLGLGWIGEPAFAHLLTPVLHLIGITSTKIITIVSLSVAFCIISFLHIVVGELMPKSMAIRQSEKMSLLTSIPLYSFYWLFYPAIYLLNASSNLLLKLLKLDAMHHGEHAYSSEEIKLILKFSHLHGELEQAEADMIEHTLDFGTLQVSDVMRPVDELIALDNCFSIEENLNRMMVHRYSRYPIYQDDIN